jgi:hypothetical protein
VFADEIGGLVENFKGQRLIGLVLWVLFAVVCERITRIISIQTVQFIETVYAFVALYRISRMCIHRYFVEGKNMPFLQPFRGLPL